MKPLLDLERGECRWPVTDTKPYLFCAEPRDGESSYCACHKAMSVAEAQPQPLTDRAADFLAGPSRPRPAKANGPRMPVDHVMRTNRCASKTAWGMP